MTASVENLKNLPDWPRLLSGDQAAAYCGLSTTAFNDHLGDVITKITTGDGYCMTGTILTNTLTDYTPTWKD